MLNYTLHFKYNLLLYTGFVSHFLSDEGWYSSYKNAILLFIESNQPKLTQLNSTQLGFFDRSWINVDLKDNVRNSQKFYRFWLLAFK